MVKVILGKAGSGKTKQVIDMVNTAVTEESGSVVCIENGQTLRLSIQHSVKLVDISEYGMELSYDHLYAFICGLYCGNYDITHVFVDGLYKVTGDDDNAKAPALLAKLEELSKQTGIKFTLTLSLDEADACDCIKKYL
jgi:hypothetical protein